MARSLFDSEYIFGIHEPGGESHMLAADRPGWILFSEAVGHDPEDRSGVDFRPFSDRGLGVICRINNGYAPQGTIPHSSLYYEFAQRVANFVATSRGCKIWVIGNEMNYAVERSGIQIDWSRHPSVHSRSLGEADPLRRGLPVRFNVLPDYSDEIRTTRAAIISPGEVITPDLYARCYRLCRDAIHRVPGHEDDQVLVGAVAPWNTQTVYPGNPNGDWVNYFREILERIGRRYCDGFTLHAYTRGPDPALIESDETLEPPFQNRHAQFRTYQDFLNVVPPAMRTLPVYITEADQSGPWLNQNSGWVQRAYREIHNWNSGPSHQSIRALCLYHWPRFDKYFIDGKQGVVEDFIGALQHDYRWTATGGDGATVRSAAEPPPAAVVPRAEPATGASAPPAPAETEASAPPPDDNVAPPEQAGEKRRRRRRRAEAKEPPPYQIEWLDVTLPERLLVGQVIHASVTVRNAGSIPWARGGSHPFRMGYHFYRNRRLLSLSGEQNLHTDIPEDVAPGESTTIDARIALPVQPGNYTLELDLFHAGVTWFKEQGANVLTRWITVEANDPFRALDGKRANGSGEDGAGRNLPVPLFVDVSAGLPRGGSGYARRGLEQVQYLVISHTAADPSLSLERIAETHVASGYPGIAYNFVIDASGQIYKVSALEEVVQPSQPWSGSGVNICLAGNFNETMPPLPQIDAAGRLCAWLLRNLELTTDAIVGLGELIGSDSPGEYFYSGPSWKELLLRQARLNVAALKDGGDEQRVRTLEDANEELQLNLQRVQDRLKQSQDEREKLRLFTEQLQQEVSQLRSELESQPEEIEPGLRIRNVIDQLPRDAGRYVERRAAAVQYVVIHHTGIEPDVPLHEIAAAHRTEWPGILYDYVIDEHGIVLQTQPLEQGVETEQPYLSQAIHVAFAGEFDASVPTDAQLYSGGRLLAWLLGRFPEVTLQSIQGICEFIDHTSPGAQWLEGQHWKEMLLQSVRRATGVYDPSELEEQLRAQLDEMQRRLEMVQIDNRSLHQQKARVETENQRLQEELRSSQEEPVNITVPEPSVHNRIDELPRHPHLRYNQRARNRITHIAVHHTATPPTMSLERIAQLHISADPSRGKEAWPGIGYHYYINADGAIEQTNPPEAISYHVYRHNEYSLGVVFAGSFMNGKIPTSAQLRAGAHLIAWLMQEFKIPLARVWGHREFSDNATVCPGSEWKGGNRWRDLLFERIEQIQKGVGLKSIRHYVLLWQRPYPGPLAHQDYVNALRYVERFRPAIGFSLNDAKNAEYVTIVGSEAGITAAEERALLDAGCKVERIAGGSEEETGRILSELARLGRRFRTLDADF